MSILNGYESLFEDLYDDPEEEYYDDPSELFPDDGLITVKEEVKGIMSDLDLSVVDEKAFHEVLSEVFFSHELLVNLTTFVVDKVCDSDTLWNYINDYTVHELGNMDGIWNCFGDTIREAIYNYFNFDN